jgi:hypothetical protein
VPLSLPSVVHHRPRLPQHGGKIRLPDNEKLILQYSNLEKNKEGLLFPACSPIPVCRTQQSKNRRVFTSWS